jgi:multidrug efflux system membrane fusion protein
LSITNARRPRWTPWFAVALIAAACGGGGDAAAKPGSGPAAAGGAAPRGPLRFPVEVAPVEAAPVEYAIEAVGSVEAFERVSVTARVAGVVERVRFQEGDRVDPSRVLAEIEPERFRLAVDSARAELAKAEAARDEAKAGLARRQAVNERNPDLVRREEVDAWRTQLASAEAEVARARASLQLAELNLRDAFVRAPATGIVQTRDVETGSYVQPGAVVATLVRRDPLLLRFRVPESDAAALVPGQTARFRLRGARDQEHRAEIALVGAAADPADRMVEVTARVADTGGAELRPGAFAEVTVPVGTPRPAPVIPQTAIRPSEKGFLAYVVEGEVARERVLELGLRTADGRVEVRDGLAVGEQLVVRGAEALAEGAGVTVRPAGDGAAAAAREPAPAGRTRP